MDLLKAKCSAENSWSLKPVLFVAILFHCLDKRKHSVSALAVMRMVVWVMRMNEVYRALPLSSHHLVAFFKKQLKVKNRVERVVLSSEDFAERWMIVGQLVQLNGSNLEWHLELTG